MGGSLQAQDKRCLCLGTGCSEHRRRNKPGGDLLILSRFVTGQKQRPKDFSLIAQTLQPINQASHSLFSQLQCCTVQCCLRLWVTLGEELVGLIQHQ